MRYIFLRRILLVVVGSLWSFQAQSGLVATVVTDTATDLKVTWTWDPEAADASTPTLTNWFGKLTISPVAEGNWSGDWQAWHETDPHPPESGGGGIAGNFFSFSETDISGYGLVVNQTSAVEHTPHGDFFTFKFDRSMLAANNSIELTGAHVVPLPAAVWLFGSGIAGLFAFARRKRA